MPVAKYIMKNHQVCNRTNKHEYCVYDGSYKNIYNLVLTPDQAKDLGLKIISPIEAYYKGNDTKNSIRSFRSNRFAIEVIDIKKHYFVLVRLSDNHRSPIYTDNMGRESLVTAYESFKTSYDMGEESFNGLCEMELQDLNYTGMHH